MKRNRLRYGRVSLTAIVMLLPLIVHAQDTLGARRERLQSMSADEKNDLLRKKQRFDSLSPVKQQRLRNLHKEISGDDSAAKLQQTLVRYNEWLKSLTTTQRAALDGLPSDKRLEKIRELKQEQELNSLRDLQLSRDELRRVFGWLNEFIDEHQEELVASMPPMMQSRLRRADPSMRHQLLRSTFMRLLASRDVPLPGPQDIAKLMHRLTPKTRKLLQNDAESEKRVVNWLDALASARMTNWVSNEELQRFFREQLSDAERTDLDLLPVDERKMELRRMYFTHRLRQRNKRDSRPGFVPDGMRRQPPGRPQPIRPNDRSTRRGDRGK